MKRLIIYTTILILAFFSCTEKKGYPPQLKEKKAKKSITTNLELTSHVYLKCNINDSLAGEFLFDTGANGLVLDKSFLAKNKIDNKISDSIVGETHGVGVGKTKHQTISGINLQIDNKTFKDLELRVMPLDSIFRQVLNHRIDGIVGYDVFGDYLIQVNFDESTFKLVDSLTSKEKQAYTKISYERKYRKPMVNIDLLTENKQLVNCELMFDMGSGRGISLTKRKGIDENLFTSELNCEKDTVAGMGGHSESCLLPADNIMFANYKLKVDTIEIGKDDKGAIGTHRMYDGLMGMEIIKSFNVIIDPNKKEIWLHKR